MKTLFVITILLSGFFAHAQTSSPKQEGGELKRQETLKNDKVIQAAPTVKPDQQGRQNEINRENPSGAEGVTPQKREQPSTIENQEMKMQPALQLREGIREELQKEAPKN